MESMAYSNWSFWSVYLISGHIKSNKAWANVMNSPLASHLLDITRPASYTRRPIISILTFVLYIFVFCFVNEGLLSFLEGAFSDGGMCRANIAFVIT